MWVSEGGDTLVLERRMEICTRDAPLGRFKIYARELRPTHYISLGELDKITADCRKEITKMSEAPLDAGAASAPPNVVARPSYFVCKAADSSTFGPADETTLREWLKTGRISLVDSICEAGQQQWQPLAQSFLASEATAAATAAQLQATTCPKCLASMAIIAKRSGFGLFLVLLGIALTPLFGIGIPIFIVGYFIRWRGQPKLSYRCPRCNFAA